MAEYFTDQYASIDDPVRNGLLTANALGGAIRPAQFTFSNSGHVENDTVRLTRLPSNSTVLGIVLSANAPNAGDCDIGTDDDPNMFLSDISVPQQGSFFMDAGSGVLTHFDTETDIVLKWRSATSATTIKGYVMYN